MGKTRLAIELATRSMEQFPGGSFFVELSSVTESAGVANAAAAALAGDRAAFVGSSSAVDQIVAYLADREALVALDNCEHVLDAAGGLIDELFRLRHNTLHRHHRSRLAASMEPERQRALYEEGRNLDVLQLATEVAAEA